MSNIDFTPGRYDIVERIGEGGMAEVYLGRVFPEGTRVAIKRLSPTFANDPRFIEMFVAEARLASTLHHPNIAEALDVGVDRDNPYFAMELVDGHDASTLLIAAVTRQQPMSLTITISIMYGTACALAYVTDPNGPHAGLNVVHRDISPSNILVSFAGAIKLVDFGIARIGAGSPWTASGQLRGKIPYMSPEQCRGRPLDGRSDLFSLGVVLYELTTNTRPFDRPSEFDTLEAIVRGEFARPSKIVPGYPADLEQVVLRLLATRPGDRYPTAGALLVDLDRVISAHDLDLSTPTLVEHIAALIGRGSPHKRANRIDTSPAAMNIPYPLSAALSADARLPIDRILAASDALLALVAPGTTDARDLPLGAVAQLLDRARCSQAEGDLEAAVLALELTLSAARADDGVDDLLQAHEELVLAVFIAFIGDQSRMAAMSQHLEQLVGIEIDQRAAFLLTRIDGTIPARELLSTCGLPKREACRHLCQLMLREIVVLV